MGQQETSAQEGEKTPVDADAAFAHLQELVDELPRMQELGARVHLAHVADEVSRLSRDLERAQATCDENESKLEELRGALEQASQQGDSAACDHLSREILYYADQLALAQGAVNDATFHLGKSLSSEGLPNADAALVHAIPADELSALEAKIASYQADYQATLALCQELGEKG